jgi:hypothetical protein
MGMGRSLPDFYLQNTCKFAVPKPRQHIRYLRG